MIKLRSNIEPDMHTVEERFSSVLKALEEYAETVDLFGDEDDKKYLELETYLRRITGKDMSKFNLYEWWEEEGAEVLAFRISLPDPVHVPDIAIDELEEIVRRIKEFDFGNPSAGKFEEDFQIYLDRYYHDLLKLNFQSYNLKLFQRNRDKSGKHFEYNIDEIINFIWQK